VKFLLLFSLLVFAAPDLVIDSTEVVAIESFERELDDGSIVTYDRKVVVHGSGFVATATWPRVEVDGKAAWGVENPDSKTITIYIPASSAGSLDVEISMPQGSVETTVDV
jgi:hypothetical protein